MTDTQKISNSFARASLLGGMITILILLTMTKPALTQLEGTTTTKILSNTSIKGLTE